MIVVSDTSPLNYLVRIEAIEVLPRLFVDIVTTPIVMRELRHPGAPLVVRAWAEAPPQWLRVSAPLRVDPALRIDDGEAEAICLARELSADWLLIDDQSGRIVAERLGLRALGTIAVIEAASRVGFLDGKAAMSRLGQTNFRMPATAIRKFRDDRGESVGS